jgi:Carbohydrate-selective porin, OprB family/S-layer homology domain
MSKVLRQLLWIAALSSTTGLVAEAAIATPATPESPTTAPNTPPEVAPTKTPSIVASAALPVSSPETIAPSSLTPASNSAPPTQLQQIAQYSNDAPRQAATPVAALDQVTSVSQLSDVRPSDWAFQALQSLVERYGCIVGYPDQTFRGNRALSRYEFAAGLNACLDRVNELISSATADLVKKEDLMTLQKLQEDFATELATLRGRVDTLEARAATLEKQQFSTTTKLRGEVIFSVAGVLGDQTALNSDQQRRIDDSQLRGLGAQQEAAERAGNGTPGSARGRLQDNTTFSDRVRLSLNTSFTGKDSLLTRLQARNTALFNNSVTGTNMTRLSYDGDEGNAISVDKLYYRFPVGKATIQVDASGGEFFANVPTFNPLLSSDGQGTISRFGRFNPIYRQGSGGAGVTVNYTLSDKLTASAGYLAVGSGLSQLGASDPSDKNGLFNGSYAALAQIAFKPSPAIDLGFTYVHSYNRAPVTRADGSQFNNNPLSGATGSAFANAPFFNRAATIGDHFSFEAAAKLSPGLTLSGWVGYTVATARNSLPFDNVANIVNNDDKASIWNWAVALALPDLGKKGNMGALIFGMPPRATSNDYGPVAPTVDGAGLLAAGGRPSLAQRIDRSPSYHLEALYRFQVNNNISVTPGLLVILNPEGNSSNDPIYVGTIRTTFTF